MGDEDDKHCWNLRRDEQKVEEKPQEKEGGIKKNETISHDNVPQDEGKVLGKIQGSSSHGVNVCPEHQFISGVPFPSKDKLPAAQEVPTDDAQKIEEKPQEKERGIKKTETISHDNVPQDEGKVLGKIHGSSSHGVNVGPEHDFISGVPFPSKEKLPAAQDVPRRPRTPRYPVGEDDEVVLTDQLIRSIIAQRGGSNLKLVIKKRLSASDVNKENRLYMPTKGFISKDFLTEEENNELEVGGNIVVRLARILGPNQLMEFDKDKPIHLKKNSHYGYNLQKNWFHFIEQLGEGLEKGTIVQVWSFRRGTELWFVVVRLQEEAGEMSKQIAEQ